jgi:hypothetical protein
MMRRCLVLSGFVASAAASGLTAQAGWERQVGDELAAVGDFLSSQGYSLTHEVQVGSLAGTRQETFWVQLPSGMQYALLAVCDGYCGNVDLELFDVGGTSIDSDYQWDDAPLVRVTPDSTGRYRVRVQVDQCDADLCSYGVGVFGRRADAANAWERQVTRQIVEVGDQLQLNGYFDTHEPRLGRLNHAATGEFYLRLLRGMTYAFVGVCDEDCTDLHLAIHDQDGDALDSDPISDNYPVLAVRPARTERYRVVVTMATCSAEPCYYGVGVYGMMPAHASFPPASNPSRNPRD